MNNPYSHVDWAALTITAQLPDAAPLTPDWTRAAACANDYELFDRVLASTNSADRTQARDELLELCAGCPVRALCHTRGVTTRSSGIWGGAELDRGRVRQPRRSRPVPQPTAA